MVATNPLALSYLHHILIAVAANDRSAPFRTFFDNWFAFKAGGPFLNANSRPHWFNNPCPDRHGEALNRAHFVSADAARTLARMDRQRLVKDHAIPVSVLRDMLMQEGPSTVGEVELIMIKYYRLGIITQREDDWLRDAGLRSRMPAGWTKECNAFARYAAVGIVPQDLGHTGRAIRAMRPRSEVLPRSFRSLFGGERHA